ncbi:MAG TPA: glycosyltransferase 87 family protein [Gaiellaceae bacterium]|nr:glycosyltransferase 87 family protein [Gaiellaceae bacterium]
MLLAAALALVAFGASWGLLHKGFYRHDQVVDTPVYQSYGDAIARGKVPYRDFGLEYPPAALPAFAIPSLLRSPQGDLGAYRRGFEIEMIVCGELLVLFVLSALLSFEAGRLRFGLALGFAALAPLLIGSVVQTRFDLWPAALTAGALAALLAGREKLASGALGLAVAAKLYPLVLVPVAGAWIWRRSGRRRALAALAVFVAALLALFVPFLVLAPDGLWASITRQTGRPLQIESLGAGVLLVLHQAAGVGITMRSSHGSQNLVGAVPHALAIVSTVLQALAVIGVWAWFVRGPAERDRLVRAFAAAVCAFIAFGKVFSPQFLVWLVPLVVLVRGRRGLAAGAIFTLALVLTQAWFPFRYWDLALRFDAVSSWLVLARDLVVICLFAALLWPLRPRLLRPA